MMATVPSLLSLRSRRMNMLFKLKTPMQFLRSAQLQKSDSHPS